MVLHPQHKLLYFKAADWEDNWIQTVEQLVCEEFECSYLSLDADSDLGREVDVLESNGNILMSDNIFDNLPALAVPKPTNSGSELNHYLSMDVEHVTNPIAWWQERCKSFPHLSCMAIDYLTIPSTSVDVERLFSCGHLVLSHVRNRLSAQSTCALLCVGLWNELGLVKSEDIIHMSKLPDVIGEEEAMDEGWDRIQVD